MRGASTMHRQVQPVLPVKDQRRQGVKRRTQQANAQVVAEAEAEAVAVAAAARDWYLEYL